MEIKGTVHEVMDTVVVSDKLQKREFVLLVEENPQYPEYLKFECIQAKCDLLDEVLPGDEVDVYFNLKGRPWTDKEGKRSYFNSLQMWKIQVLKTGNEASKIVPDIAGEGDDDLPF